MGGMGMGDGGDVCVGGVMGGSRTRRAGIRRRRSMEAGFEISPSVAGGVGVWGERGGSYLTVMAAPTAPTKAAMASVLRNCAWLWHWRQSPAGSA